LYSEPAGVSELWLSTFAGAPPAAHVIGEPFADDAAICRALPQAGAPALREEASGPWRFERRWR
ncbi:MAG: hypothetical protein ACREI8_01125, partial [Myxococcota bacterium]